MEETLQEILTEIKGIKQEMSSMKQSQVSMKQELSNIKQNQDSMKQQLNNMKAQQDENIQILRTPEHKADVNKAELNNISTEIAEIKGTQKKILKDIEDIKLDVNILTINTAKNSLDVARLKYDIGS